MNAPTLPRQALGQRALLDLLTERRGAIVTLPTIARRLFGQDTWRDRHNALRVVQRLRKRLPGLEIETVTGYRIRRGF